MLPDLTIMGKIVGGGLPAAAYGGSRELMERIAPAGDVYQAGTLSGNPLAVAAALATLRQLDARRLRAAGADHRARSPPACAKPPPSAGRQSRCRACPGLLTVFFTERPVTQLRRRGRAATPEAYGALVPGAARARGVPAAVAVRGLVSRRFAHTDEHVERTVEAAARGVRGGRLGMERARDGALALAAELRHQDGTPRPRSATRSPGATSRRGQGPPDRRRRTSRAGTRGRVRAPDRDDPRGIAAALRRPARDPRRRPRPGPAARRSALRAWGCRGWPRSATSRRCAELADLISLLAQVQAQLGHRGTVEARLGGRRDRGRVGRDRRARGGQGARPGRAMPRALQALRRAARAARLVTPASLLTVRFAGRSIPCSRR